MTLNEQLVITLINTLAALCHY